MNTDHFRKLERMYLSANVNTEIYDTTTCDISRGTSEIGLLIHDKYFHALGAIHGSVYFKLLDDAAFFAVNSLVEDVFVLTSSFHISFLRPANQGRLRAIGQVLSESKKLYTAESTLYNEAGKIIAVGTGTFVKTNHQLSENIGYI